MCNRQITHNISFNADTFRVSFARTGPSPSSENGLVWSGLVVLSDSATVEPGRGGITGFVSIKLCRGLWILLGGELALEKYSQSSIYVTDTIRTIYPSTLLRLAVNLHLERELAGVELVATKAKQLVNALEMETKI